MGHKQRRNVEKGSKHRVCHIVEGRYKLPRLSGKKRADIQAKATKTTTDLKNLSTLNNEIAKTTKEAVISDFDKKLQEELAACQTIGARLDLLEQRRKELSGDNSDVDNAKKDIIDDAKKTP